ncbi:MAG: CHAD domain-containing protein [Aquabacterium sp.]|uniref:CHAD domain-containing protein n=1 Tax=Aquabacterium sp. TaxID=1872578 RepID=UPI00271F4F7F|nr:CHAD domain-containing protein [Aquabacterium sp.]MDO9005799.1 CHAD domain-containing protein [Aquabacterium sp.]
MFKMELKLAGGAVSKARLLQALALESVPKTLHREHYFDTPTGQLAAGGVLLAMSFEDGVWRQTLCLSDGGSSKVPIDMVDLPEHKGKDVPFVHLDRHRSKLSARALRRALNWRAGEPVPTLIQQFVLRFERRMLDMEAGQGRLRLQLDLGTIRAQGSAWPCCEVVMKLDSRDGLQRMFALAQRLVHDHGMCLGMTDPALRGLNLIGSSGPLSASLAGPVKFDAAGDADQQFRAMVRHGLEHILLNAPEFVDQPREAERIHQLRVGIRRLRTLLTEVGSSHSGVNPAWQVALARVFRKLGAQRDQDLLGDLQRKMADAGAPELLGTPAFNPNAPLSRDAVRTPDFQSVLIDLLCFSICSSTTPSVQAQTLRKLLKRRLEALHHKVLSDGKRFASLPEAQQHRVRKRLKRLRYLSEFARPLFKRGKVDRYLEALRPAQDALGAYNDRITALTAWRTHTKADAHAWFAVGWLSAGRDQATQACQTALHEIEKVARFWP